MARYNKKDFKRIANESLKANKKENYKELELKILNRRR